MLYLDRLKFAWVYRLVIALALALALPAPAPAGGSLPMPPQEAHVIERQEQHLLAVGGVSSRSTHHTAPSLLHRHPAAAFPETKAPLRLLVTGLTAVLLPVSYLRLKRLLLRPIHFTSRFVVC